MPFKSLINIRDICPLAEIQRPVNANEWEREAIGVHYWLPLVRKGASLRLSTGGPSQRQTHNSKLLRPLNDRWETWAFFPFQRKDWTQADYGSVFSFCEASTVPQSYIWRKCIEMINNDEVAVCGGEVAQFI